MAKERVSRTICDRCKTVYEEIEAEVKPAGGSSDSPPKIYIEMDGAKVLSMDDLCKKCDDRVQSLIKDLALEKPEKKGKASKRSKSGDKKSDSKDTSDSSNKDKSKPSADAASASTKN